MCSNFCHVLKDYIYVYDEDSLCRIISLEGDSLVRYNGKMIDDSLMVELTLPVRKIEDRLYRVEWNGFSKDSLVRHAIYRNGYNRSKSEEMEMKIKALLPDFENRIVRFDTLSLVMSRGIPERNQGDVFKYKIWRYTVDGYLKDKYSLFHDLLDNYFESVWMPDRMYVFKDSPYRKVSIQFCKPNLLFVWGNSGRDSFYEIYRVRGHFLKGGYGKDNITVEEKLYSTRESVSDHYILPNEHILFDMTKDNCFPDLTGFTIVHEPQRSWFDAFAVGPFLFLLQNE